MTMLALPFLITALAFSTSQVAALNDWSVPCTNGKCSYDWTGDGNTKAFSSLALDGSNQLLSDITPAAGWKVWKCNPNWTDGNHTLLMVCDGTAAQVAECNHVYDSGAVNKVVRLPQGCAGGPFARIQATFEPTNETIPDNIRSQMTRDPSTVAVRGLTLDFDFNSVPTSKGKLNFAISSSNSAQPSLSRRHHDFYKRGRSKGLQKRFSFGDLGKDIGNAVSDATSAVAAAATNAASAVVSVATEAATAVTSAASAAESVATQATSEVKSVATAAASDIKSVATEVATKVTSAAKTVATDAKNLGQAALNATSFNETKTNGNVPLKFNQNFTLLDTDINCVGFKTNIDAHVHIDMDADMDANVNYGYTLAGSLIPLKFNDVGVFAKLTGTANTTFNLALQATGTLDTFPITLLKFGLPGLSIPGVAALGPELVLQARLKMDLDAAAQMQVKADFDFGNVEMQFPNNNDASKATSSVGNNKNSISLSTANGGADISGTVEALLIPRFNFGIDAKIVQAAVFLEMQAGAVMEAAGNAGIGGGSAASADGTDTTDDTTDTTDDGSDATADDGSDATDDSTDASAADDTSADDATADDSTDDASADDTTADDSTADDGSADDSTADDSTADDSTDDATADDSTADDGSADDATADDGSADDATADDGSADDATADDGSADDATADDASADDTTDATADDSTDDASADDTTDATSADDSTDDTSADASTDDSSADDTTDDSSADDSTDDASADNSTAPAVSKAANGCVQVNGVMSINFGLSGQIEPLFPQAITIPLFNTTKQLFQKCFNGATPDILQNADAQALSDGIISSSLLPADASTDDSTAADDTTSDVSARSLSIRRRYASLQRRESLADLAKAAVPTLTSAAINALVCPSGGISALSTLASLI